MRGSYPKLFGALAATSAVRWSPSLAFSSYHIDARPSTRFPTKCWTSASTSTTASYETLKLGGDFASLQAKFSLSDGSLVPIPVHLIPESLLEWGQEPSSLEVLTSEEWNGDDKIQLQRQEITVLPETGCGVDNLETMKSVTELEKGQVEQSQPSESTLTLDATTSTQGETTTQRLETYFSLPEAHRVRVSLDLEIVQDDESDFSYSIQAPITLHLERQTNTTSSQGTRADGGGLDGRTVSQLLGDWLRQSQSFAEKPFTPGDWKAQQQQLTTIHLPGNITIASGKANDAWILEMSHFTAGVDSPTCGSKRILQRKYNGAQCEATYKEDVGEYMS